MTRLKLTLLLFLFIAMIDSKIGKPAADEMGEAVAKAGLILTLLNEKKFSIVWELHVSPYFKSVTVEDHFIANMTLGRSTLGPLSASKHISTEFSTQDPAFDYTGRLYAVIFLNTYGVGKVYERLVIVLDKDGELRLGGIMGAPAPK